MTKIRKKKYKRVKKTPTKEYERIEERFEYLFPDWKTYDNDLLSKLVDKFLPDYRLYFRDGEPLEFKAYLLEDKIINKYVRKGKIIKTKVNNTKFRKNFKRYIGIKGIPIKKLKLKKKKR
jgi:hypothetical protein